MHQTFSARVIALAQSIPAGRVTTYGDIARAAGGGPQAARSITGILGRAYQNGITDIPFHRIVYADGRIWMTDEQHAERMQRYADEGIVITNGKIRDFDSLRM
ncbi:MAG: MGMT family protein [Candidatus Pacebacteria bacterium]|nr:MGMT family protein [Candidatus Paceibacterota bacterium]